MPYEVFSLFTRCADINWRAAPPSEPSRTPTFLGFLHSVDDLYVNWRYFQRGTERANPQAHLGDLLRASGIVLDAVHASFRQRFPIKIKTTMVQPEGSSSIAVPSVHPELVEGIVRTTIVPRDFAPYADVEMVICSENGGGDIKALFRESNVEAYYGLEGQRVSLAGYISDAEPQVLMNAHHNTPRTTHRERPLYTQEQRELRGSVYNMSPSEDISGVTTTTLVLSDTVYLSNVLCLFTTDHERKQLSAVRLGDEILIRGLVTLRNGRPLVLIGPELVDHSDTGIDARAASDTENFN